MALRSPRWNTIARLRSASENSPPMRIGELNHNATVVLQEALIENGFSIPAGLTGNYLQQTAAPQAFLRVALLPMRRFNQDFHVAAVLLTSTHPVAYCRALQHYFLRCIRKTLLCASASLPKIIVYAAQLSYSKRYRSQYAP
jgi:hypothetical protein